MTLYLDTEFNGHGGELISLARDSPSPMPGYQLMKNTNVVELKYDRKCAECGKPYAAGNGLCLKCSAKALGKKPLKSAHGRAVQIRYGKAGVMICHAEFNVLVQDMQRFCIAAGLEHRIIDNVRLYGSEPPITRVFFQVYFDGKWETIGSEVPFAKTDEERSAEYWTQKDMSIRSRVSDAVCRS